MEASALRYTGGIGLYGRTPLLRLQSDERLIALIRRGNPAAFEILVARYQSRLLAFCRHLLGSREDAEDILQEALAAAFNAILADDRPINVRPWLYRIARNRCLNHLRRIQAVGVDSMDIHLSEHGTSTADKVHRLEEFRTLVGDIQELPETQKTALVLREMDALSYEQIAEAMETTVPSVKSLLVRARVSLAEAAEARMLSCDEVRLELAETAEGLRKKVSPVVRRHMRACERCSTFQVQLKQTSKALTAVLPITPLVLLKKLLLTHLGHSAGAGSSSAAGQAAAVGSSAAAGSAVVGSGAGSVISFGVGTIATKAAAGLAAAALVTAGAVEVSHDSPSNPARRAPAAVEPASAAPAASAARLYHSIRLSGVGAVAAPASTPRPQKHAAAAIATHKQTATKTATATTASLTTKPTTKAGDKTATAKQAKATTTAGRTDTQTQTTVLSSSAATTSGATTGGSTAYDQSGTGSTTSNPSTTSTGATSPATSGDSASPGASTDPGTSTTSGGSTPDGSTNPGDGSGTTTQATSPSSGGAPVDPAGSLTSPTL